MKKTAIVAALAASLIGTAAHAGSIKVEAESQLNKAEREAVKVEVWEGLTGPVGVGFEVKTFLAEGTNASYTNLVGKIGYALPTISGFSPVIKAEAGVKTGVGNAEFWGVGAEVQRKLTDKVTATVGYRYRDGFGDEYGSNQQRAHVGVSYGLTKNSSVGATYYNYRKDSQNTDAVALSLTKKF